MHLNTIYDWLYTKWYSIFPTQMDLRLPITDSDMEIIKNNHELIKKLITLYPWRITYIPSEKITISMSVDSLILDPIYVAYIPAALRTPIICELVERHITSGAMQLMRPYVNYAMYPPKLSLKRLK